MPLVTMNKEQYNVTPGTRKCVTIVNENGDEIVTILKTAKGDDYLIIVETPYDNPDVTLRNGKQLENLIGEELFAETKEYFEK